MRSLLSSAFLSWWAVTGSSTATPRAIMGVITMKMMSSTSTTSTSGVTLISARTPPLAWRFETRCRLRGGSPGAGGLGGSGLTRCSGVALEDRVDELGGRLVDVDRDVVELGREVVEEPHRHDGDAEAHGRRDERLGDAGRDGADAAAALGRVGELLEGGDDAADGAEEAHEGRRRRHGREHGQAAPQARELALLHALHRAVDGLGDV